MCALFGTDIVLTTLPSRQHHLLQAKPDPREVLPVPAQAGLNDDNTSFVEEHRIRSYEVGPDQHTTIVTIANLMQVGSCFRVLV